MSICLALMVPVVIFLLVIMKIRYDSRVQYQQRQEEFLAQGVARQLDNELEIVSHLAEELTNTPWVIQRASSCEVFDKAFTLSNKLRIQNMLSLQCSRSSVFANVAVIFPPQDVVAAKTGWYSIDEFYRSLGYKSEEEQALLDYMVRQRPDMMLYTRSVQDDSFIVLTRLDVYTLPRAVLLVRLDKKALDQKLAALGITNLSGVVIAHDNRIVYEKKGEANTTLLEYTRSSGVCDAQISVYIQKEAIPLFGTQLAAILLPCLFGIVLGLGLSFGIASRGYAPVKKIVDGLHESRLKKESVHEGCDEFVYIQGALSYYEQENQRLEHSMELCFHDARTSIMLRLLHGYFDGDAQAVLEMYHLPVHPDGRYLCILFGSTGTDPARIIRSLVWFEAQLEKMEGIIGIVDDMEGERCAIIGLKPDQTIRDLRDALNDLLASSEEESNVDAPLVTCGTVQQGVLGISLSYQQARRQHLYTLQSLLDEDQPQQRYLYPTDWEVQLINKLKINDVHAAEEMLRRIELENNQLSLSENEHQRLVEEISATIRRVLKEQGIKPHQTETSFAHLYDLVRSLKDDDPHELPVSQMKKRLRELMQEIDQPSELSLKSLANDMNMSLPSLSRLFKETYGIHFSDYVSRLRMENAKALIRSGEIDMLKIAQAAGYESEYSLRRAFSRIEGIRLDDWLKSKENDVSRSCRRS